MLRENLRLSSWGVTAAGGDNEFEIDLDERYGASFATADLHSLSVLSCVSTTYIIPTTSDIYCLCCPCWMVVGYNTSAVYSIGCHCLQSGHSESDATGKFYVEHVSCTLFDLC